MIPMPGISLRKAWMVSMPSCSGMTRSVITRSTCPCPRLLQRLLSVRRFRHFVAGLLQRRPQETAHSGFVVGHQDAGWDAWALQHFANFHGQLVRTERLLDELRALLQNPVVHDGASVYPDMNSTLIAGRSPFSRSARSGPLTCGITTSVNTR